MNFAVLNRRRLLAMMAASAMRGRLSSSSAVRKLASSGT